eukprot:gnl/TRDRNA2_/TRDRNA2_180970_c0_seq1.p1 gnl/TRDRNA2_/TRDRNA2_180970_c0~~gnl/TRDRNA2_/TRDRNA2_180970_c0_seq1.p1  ORF type:complete len:472 (-),score=84.06 gnl/TRDRNA2_/TRDRNA2_180970_c0_seq1:278-1693(-)
MVVAVYLVCSLVVLLFDAGASARYSRFKAMRGDHQAGASISRAPGHDVPAKQKIIEKADPSVEKKEVEGPLVEKANALIAMSDPLNQVALRPHAGEEADVVTFGIFVKGFYGMDIKHSTWSADLVLTLMWNDPRNIRLVPAGHEEVTLDVEAAKSHIWLPDMILSNRARGGVESISTAFTIHKDGTVVKVERVSAMLQSGYSLSAFPFDTQLLRATLASSKYMLEDLKLQPTNDTAIFGMDASLLDGKDITLDSFELREREDKSGSLQKSRGDLLITVHRNAEPYLMGILWPEFVMVMISWSVFWLPLLAPFAMPRVATALIAFLTLMTLSLRTNAMLPMRGDTSWLDLVELNCSGLLLYNVVFNTVVLVMYHVLNEHTLAEVINHELIFVYAGMAIVLTIICLCATGGAHLHIFTIVCNVLRAGMGLGFVASCLVRLYKLRQERAAAAATPEAGAAEDPTKSAPPSAAAK